MENENIMKNIKEIKNLSETEFLLEKLCIFGKTNTK